jgi:heme exporter protein A
LTSYCVLLEINDIACKRGERLLFEGVSFAIEPGQILWVRGHNGQGKTSLLRLLAGLATPVQGSITWGGKPIRRAGAEYLSRLVYIGHANAIKEDLSVAESLQFLAQLHGKSVSEDRCADALRAVGLYSRRNAPVRTLSQGQRRRVALARLFNETQPGVWILDEPFDALDVEGIGTLNGVLQTHVHRGGSVVLTSHLELTMTNPGPVSLHLKSPVRQ